MKVRVQQGMTGYYEHLRRREGDVFSIPDEPRRKVSEKELQHFPAVKDVMRKDGTVPQHYSSRWMEPAGPAETERTTKAQEIINRKHDETLTERAQQRQADAGVI